MTQCCLFDMDGLLLDTERIYFEVNSEILARFGKTFTWDIKAQVMGAKERQAAELVIQHYQIPLSIDEYIQERREKLAAKFPDCKVLPGVYRLIQHLKASGVPICVATSSRREAFEIKSSSHKEFFALFDGHVICGDDEQVKNGKPAPDIFLASAKSLGLNATIHSNNRNCLVFEDAILGARAGMAANMTVIMVPDTNLAIPSDLTEKCAKILRSMEEFDPAEFGLPAFP